MFDNNPRPFKTFNYNLSNVNKEFLVEWARVGDSTINVFVNEKELTRGTEFTIISETNKYGVRILAALKAGDNIRLERFTPRTGDGDLTINNVLRAEDVQNAMNRLTAIVQEITSNTLREIDDVQVNVVDDTARSELSALRDRLAAFVEEFRDLQDRLNETREIGRSLTEVRRAGPYSTSNFPNPRASGLDRWRIDVRQLFGADLINTARSRIGADNFDSFLSKFITIRTLNAANNEPITRGNPNNFTFTPGNYAVLPAFRSSSSVIYEFTLRYPTLNEIVETFEYGWDSTNRINQLDLTGLMDFTYFNLLNIRTNSASDQIRANLYFRLKIRRGNTISPHLAATINPITKVVSIPQAQTIPLASPAIPLGDPDALIFEIAVPYTTTSYADLLTRLLDEVTALSEHLPTEKIQELLDLLTRFNGLETKLTGIITNRVQGVIDTLPFDAAAKTVRSDATATDLLEYAQVVSTFIKNEAANVRTFVNTANLAGATSDAAVQLARANAGRITVLERVQLSSTEKSQLTNIIADNNELEQRLEQATSDLSTARSQITGSLAQFRRDLNANKALINTNIAAIASIRTNLKAVNEYQMSLNNLTSRFGIIEARTTNALVDLTKKFEDVCVKVEQMMDQIAEINALVADTETPGLDELAEAFSQRLKESGIDEDPATSSMVDIYTFENTDLNFIPDTITGSTAAGYVNDVDTSLVSSIGSSTISNFFTTNHKCYNIAGIYADGTNLSLAIQSADNNPQEDDYPTTIPFTLTGSEIRGTPITATLNIAGQRTRFRSRRPLGATEIHYSLLVNREGYYFQTARGRIVNDLTVEGDTARVYWVRLLLRDQYNRRGQRTGAFIFAEIGIAPIWKTDAGLEKLPRVVRIGDSNFTIPLAKTSRQPTITPTADFVEVAGERSVSGSDLEQLLILLDPSFSNTQLVHIHLEQFNHVANESEMEIAKGNLTRGSAITTLPGDPAITVERNTRLYTFALTTELTVGRNYEFKSDTLNRIKASATTLSEIGAGGGSDTAQQIKTKLETLTGTNRLSATAIKDLPSGTFSGLTDTPANYTGEAGKIAAVKTDETGLEFITAPSGGGSITPVQDLPELADISNSDLFRVGDITTNISDSAINLRITPGTIRNTNDLSFVYYGYYNTALTRRDAFGSGTTSGSINPSSFIIHGITYTIVAVTGIFFTREQGGPHNRIRLYLDKAILDANGNVITTDISFSLNGMNVGQSTQSVGNVRNIANGALQPVSSIASTASVIEVDFGTVDFNFRSLRTIQISNPSFGTVTTTYEEKKYTYSDLSQSIIGDIPSTQDLPELGAINDNDLFRIGDESAEYEEKKYTYSDLSQKVITDIPPIRSLPALTAITDLDLFKIEDQTVNKKFEYRDLAQDLRNRFKIDKIEADILKNVEGISSNTREIAELVNVPDRVRLDSITPDYTDTTEAFVAIDGNNRVTNLGTYTGTFRNSPKSDNIPYKTLDGETGIPGAVLHSGSATSAIETVTTKSVIFGIRVYLNNLTSSISIDDIGGSEYYTIIQPSEDINTVTGREVDRLVSRTSFKEYLINVPVKTWTTIMIYDRLNPDRTGRDNHTIREIYYDGRLEVVTIVHQFISFLPGDGTDYDTIHSFDMLIVPQVVGVYAPSDTSRGFNNTDVVYKNILYNYTPSNEPDLTTKELTRLSEDSEDIVLPVNRVVNSITPSDKWDLTNVPPANFPKGLVEHADSNLITTRIPEGKFNYTAEQNTSETPSGFQGLFERFPGFTKFLSGYVDHEFISEIGTSSYGSINDLDPETKVYINYNGNKIYVAAAFLGYSSTAARDATTSDEILAGAFLVPKAVADASTNIRLWLQEFEVTVGTIQEDITTESSFHIKRNTKIISYRGINHVLWTWTWDSTNVMDADVSLTHSMEIIEKPDGIQVFEETSVLDTLTYIETELKKLTGGRPLTTLETVGVGLQDMFLHEMFNTYSRAELLAEFTNGFNFTTIIEHKNVNLAGTAFRIRGQPLKGTTVQSTDMIKFTAISSDTSMSIVQFEVDSDTAGLIALNVSASADTDGEFIYLDAVDGDQILARLPVIHINPELKTYTDLTLTPANSGANRTYTVTLPTDYEKYTHLHVKASMQYSTRGNPVCARSADILLKDLTSNAAGVKLVVNFIELTFNPTTRVVTIEKGNRLAQTDGYTGGQQSLYTVNFVELHK